MTRLRFFVEGSNLFRGHLEVYLRFSWALKTAQLCLPANVFLSGTGSFIFARSVLSIQESGILFSIQTSELGMAWKARFVSR